MKFLWELSLISITFSSRILSVLRIRKRSMYYDNYNGYFFVALDYCKIKRPAANTAQLYICLETFILRNSSENP